MNLNTDPEAILNLAIGAEVHLDGYILRLESNAAVDGKVFLTTVTSRPDEYNRLNNEKPHAYGVQYHKYIQHFRAGDVRDGYADIHAAMPRQEMYERLLAKTYTIS